MRSVALFRKLLLLVSYDKPTNQRNCLSRSVECYQDFGLRSEQTTVLEKRWVSIYSAWWNLWSIEEEISVSIRFVVAIIHTVCITIILFRFYLNNFPTVQILSFPRWRFTRCEEKIRDGTMDIEALNIRDVTESQVSCGQNHCSPLKPGKQGCNLSSVSNMPIWSSDKLATLNFS